MNSKFVTGAALGAAALLLAGSASASVTYSGSSGALAASAEFSASGGILTIVLTNTGLADVNNAAQLLTGVYWDVAGSPLSLGRISAVVAPGSSALICGTGAAAPTDAGNVVGGEWAYKGALGGAPGGAKYGISSSGLGLFGPGDRFSGNNLQGPDSPDGAQYGITSAGDDILTGNGSVSGSGLIKNAVTLKLEVALNFDVNNLSNVQFQYGTDLSEPHFGGNLPSPGAMALLGVSGLLASRRRR